MLLPGWVLRRLVPEMAEPPAERAGDGPPAGERRGAAPGSVYVDQGLLFSGAALVTVGGAYAVRSYVAQQAVEVYGWLAPWR